MNKMNRLLLMAVAVYAAVPVWAANVVTATSDIKSVIVYQRGGNVLCNTNLYFYRKGTFI
jgi:hypothetical protein